MISFSLRVNEINLKFRQVDTQQMFVTFPTCEQIPKQRTQNCPHVTHQETLPWYYKQKGIDLSKIKEKKDKTKHYI